MGKHLEDLVASALDEMTCARFVLDELSVPRGQFRIDFVRYFPTGPKCFGPLAPWLHRRVAAIEHVSGFASLADLRRIRARQACF